MAKIKISLKQLKTNALGYGAAGAAVGLGGTMGLDLLRNLLKDPNQSSRQVQLQSDLETAKQQSRSAQIADFMEQARLEKSFEQNKQRLAQSAPDLYSSVMAGQRLPKGSVVLGGRPREDLMRQLAASMDSGRFRKQDPLSELMG